MTDVRRSFEEWAPLVLSTFSREHGLSLTPRFKESRDWALHFQHPLRGVGQIQVSPLDDGRVMVAGAWWRDDFPTETRYFAGPGEPAYPAPDADALGIALRETLEAILALNEGDLVGHAMQKGMWHRYATEETFTEWEQSLPKVAR